jgi:hypothetical protein
MTEIDQALELIGSRNQIINSKRRGTTRLEERIDDSKMTLELRRVVHLVRHLRREVIESGVAKPEIAIVFLDREGLDGGDAEIVQVRYFFHDIEESTVLQPPIMPGCIDRPERTDMKLINDEIPERGPLPSLIVPWKSRGVADKTWAIGIS